LHQITTPNITIGLIAIVKKKI